MVSIVPIIINSMDSIPVPKIIGIGPIIIMHAIFVDPL